MRSLTRLFAGKEIRAVLGVLDELEIKYPTGGFRMVRGVLEQEIRKQPGLVRTAVTRFGARPAIYNKIANTAGDLLASGRFHVYRGVLDPLSVAPQLLQLFDGILDQGLAESIMDSEQVESQKSGIREQIADVG